MIQKLGERVLDFLDQVGLYAILCMRTVKAILTLSYPLREVFYQAVRLGINSLPITIITLSFVGMVFSTQVCIEFVKLGAVKMIGGIVGLAIWRELGPLLTGVVVAGRVGASISAELGSMKVTEQIAAIETMAVDPIDYLVTPRFIAVMVMMPLLITFADFVGFIGGLLVAVLGFHANWYAYFVSASQMLKPIDIWGGVLVKGPVFGIIIASLASYFGMSTQGGARGVGNYTTRAVVVILMVLFVANYFLSILLFH